MSSQPWEETALYWKNLYFEQREIVEKDVRLIQRYRRFIKYHRMTQDDKAFHRGYKAGFTCCKEFIKSQLGL